MHKTALLLLGLNIHAFSSNAQDWLWAQSGGGISDDYSYGVFTDTEGNVYIAGEFDSSSITFGSTTLPNAGDVDIFIAKYDSNGVVLWAKSAGGTDYDAAYSVSSDAAGNVYLSGEFYSDSITFGSTILTNAGIEDVFIAKYDKDGVVLWAKSMGGTDADWANSVATDASGNVYITGEFYSASITFGSTVLTNTAGFGSDIFIAKYEGNGTTLWAKSAGGTKADWANSIATDAAGNIYITGSFRSPSITFGSTVLTNAGNENLFITKYDSNGTVLWANSAGGTDYDQARSIAKDAAGNVYITGSFGSPSISFGSTILTNAGVAFEDIFITKYDNNGTVLWAKSAGGPNGDGAMSISIDPWGMVYIVGQFVSPSITFGSTLLMNQNSGFADIFLAKYDNNGTALWGKRAGATSGDWAQGVATDTRGNVYVAGQFYSPSITFDTSALTNAAGGGSSDIFIAKLGGTGTTGINGKSFIDEITIFPNPCSSQAILQTDRSLHNATLTMYNVFGQTVRQIKNISAQTVTLERDNLPSGLYFIRLTEYNLLVGRTDKTVALVISD